MQGPIIRDGESLSDAIARVLAEPEPMRRCTRCRKMRPQRLFYANLHMRDGWACWCFRCYVNHYNPKRVAA